jgi:hypothetical protein
MRIKYNTLTDNAGMMAQKGFIVSIKYTIQKGTFKKFFIEDVYYKYRWDILINLNLTDDNQS